MVVTAMDKPEQDQQPQPEQNKTLEQRIADVLQADVTSTALGQLLQEVQTGAAEASKRALPAAHAHSAPSFPARVP
jgi:hypothetical protein